MALPTYEQIATQLDIPHCWGVRPNGQRCYSNHEKGEVADGLVHWLDRTPRRPGIRRFLWLAALLRLEGEGAGVIPRPRPSGGEPVSLNSRATREWDSFYWVQRELTEMAKKIHVHFSTALSREDRLRLKAMLANVRVDAVGRDEAMRWASR